MLLLLLVWIKQTALTYYAQGWEIVAFAYTVKSPLADTFYERLTFKYGQFYRFSKITAECDDKSVLSVTLCPLNEPYIYLVFPYFFDFSTGEKCFNRNRLCVVFFPFIYLDCTRRVFEGRETIGAIASPLKGCIIV